MVCFVYFAEDVFKIADKVTEGFACLNTCKRIMCKRR